MRLVPLIFALILALPSAAQAVEAEPGDMDEGALAKMAKSRAKAGSQAHQKNTDAASLIAEDSGNGSGQGLSPCGINIGNAVEHEAGQGAEGDHRRRQGRRDQRQQPLQVAADEPRRTTVSAAKQFGRGRYLALAASIAVLLPGCAGQVREETLQAAEEVRKGPEAPPFRSITNFSVALRCMDNHMITFGVRDVSVLVEDLADQTKKVNAGTRDMLISAVSDMTKRSRAIRLVAYGQDSGNLIGFLKEAERKNAYSVIPQYDIKGSISQFDESVAKKDSSFGISFAEVFNYGRANVGNATILGIDLTVLNTEDLSVVPGVTSRNGVLIYKQGKGTDADAQYHKFGINFTTALSKAEGNSQALRNLVELAVIELFGKLTKVPYWSCLGADPKSEAVSNEMADWYYTMTGDAAELIAYFQYQLSIRGFYNGPVDSASNPQLATAITDAEDGARFAAQRQDQPGTVRLLSECGPRALAGGSGTQPGRGAPARGSHPSYHRRRQGRRQVQAR
ncbi:MAG: hypothetical protein MZW92_21995 [Comamonadaceae bacterium]|nr:hypothetical protein [Comamonadaceae bacterium]